MMSFRISLGLALGLSLASAPLQAQALDELALILPLKGRMAKAATVIRDGFLAAYYQDLSQDRPSPIVRIYDNGEGHGVTLVNMAAFDGAQAVVGPLNKEQVTELAKVGAPPVPVLALNRAEQSSPLLYQFALAPEDEISSLVAQLRQDGVTRLRVLSQDDAGSRRHQQLFEEQWQAAGGELITAYVLAPAAKGGITAAVKQFLAEQKLHGAQALFLATPQLARQVRPALDYYYARDLPLYTLASAYDASEALVNRQDLNGVRLCDQPWIVQGGWPEQAELYSPQQRPRSSYDRLYAFGADAYNSIQALYLARDTLSLEGRSGRLSLNDKGQLQRAMSCVEIRHGSPEPLASLRPGP